MSDRPLTLGGFVRMNVSSCTSFEGLVVFRIQIRTTRSNTAASYGRSVGKLSTVDPVYSLIV